MRRRVVDPTLHETDTTVRTSSLFILLLQNLSFSFHFYFEKKSENGSRIIKSERKRQRNDYKQQPNKRWGEEPANDSAVKSFRSGNYSGAQLTV